MFSKRHQSSTEMRSLYFCVLSILGYQNKFFPSSKFFGELDYKESWEPKNWCFWTVVLEKILESPLDCKEIQSVHPKGNQSWIFTGRTDAEAETPILWPPHAKSWLIGKDPDAGRDWGQEEKGTTEDEMAGWHHRPDGHEFEQTPGVGEGQGSLACCSPWGHKSQTQLSNWTEVFLPTAKSIPVSPDTYLIHSQCSTEAQYMEMKV